MIEIYITKIKIYEYFVDMIFPELFYKIRAVTIIPKIFVLVNLFNYCERTEQYHQL